MITSTEFLRRREPKRRTRGATHRLRRRKQRRRYPRVRRKKGDKSKNAKVAFVAVLYTLKKTRRGVEGPIGKRIIATFESHEALFKKLVPEALKRGYGQKRTIFLGDGSEHIWRNQEKYLPHAEVCLDWYHLVEKLWVAGACLFHEGSYELHAWIAEQTARLRRGHVRAVFKALLDAFESVPKTGPGNKGRRNRLSQVLQYFSEHEKRLNYRKLRDEDLDIGTGAVEGAVRNLVGMRLDGPGMRWGRDRAESLVQLRSILLSDQWEDFCTYLESRNVRLAAQPVPTRTHDADPHPTAEAA